MTLEQLNKELTSAGWNKSSMIGQVVYSKSGSHIVVTHGAYIEGFCQSVKIEQGLLKDSYLWGGYLNIEEKGIRLGKVRFYH